MHRLLLLVAATALLGAVVPATASARKSSRAWQRHANSICRATATEAEALLATSEPGDEPLAEPPRTDVLARIRAGLAAVLAPLLPESSDAAAEEAAERAALADLLEQLSSLSLRGDDRLARVRPPRKLVRRYRRMVRLDRKANGELPLQVAALLRQPPSDENDDQILALSDLGEQLNSKYVLLAQALGLRDCAGTVGS